MPQDTNSYGVRDHTRDIYRCLILDDGLETATFLIAKNQAQ